MAEDTADYDARVSAVRRAHRHVRVEGGYVACTCGEPWTDHRLHLAEKLAEADLCPLGKAICNPLVNGCDGACDGIAAPQGTDSLLGRHLDARVISPAKWHEFDEDVADGSMCICGVSALSHDSIFPPGSGNADG